MIDMLCIKFEGMNNFIIIICNIRTYSTAFFKQIKSAFNE